MPDSSLPGPAMPQDNRTFREMLAANQASKATAGKDDDK